MGLIFYFRSWEVWKSCLGFYDVQDVGFFYDQQFVVVDGNFCVGLFVEQDVVVGFDVECVDRVVFFDGVVINSNDFVFLWFFFSGIGDDDVVGGFGFFFDVFYEDVVM